ncbi:chorismate mutase [Bombilactobacillus bombi]|uniref:chorismate mutase n=1 Tax=Bombilactobacillus bombi TaxID=1303590 RepID=UPI0015E5DB16|nr:chorismate mutase [Bombilactobacillus bombi]MBA1434242.1 hypothetical protein [Bombilactobacillus bombi]
MIRNSDYEAQMQQLDQQILQLFAQKLDLAQKAVEHQQPQAALLATRGQDLITQNKQLAAVAKPQYRSYLQDLFQDLRIITRQYQAKVYRQQQDRQTNNDQ